jgi:hypothetical protein
MTDIGDQLARARRHVLAKEFVAALYVADEIVAVAPASVDALELRMLVLMEMDRFEMSCETARQILQIDPDNPRAAETLDLLSRW